MVIFCIIQIFLNKGFIQFFSYQKTKRHKIPCLKIFCSLIHALLPGGSDGEESACLVGDLGSIPGSGRSPGEGNGNSLQYSCLENPMGGGVWQSTVHGVAKSRTQLSDHFLSFLIPFQRINVVCIISQLGLLLSLSSGYES